MIANIIIGVSAIWSLLLSRESLKQVKIESQNSQDFQFALKKQDIEQWVLREDIFVTVIPVFSLDWFSKIKYKKASWKSGLLKIMKHSSGMREYLIIDPAHYTNWDDYILCDRMDNPKWHFSSDAKKMFWLGWIFKWLRLPKDN